MKIPKRLKGTEVVAITKYAVFTKSLFTAMAVADKVEKKEGDRVWRVCGYVLIKGKRVWWVKYGFLNDASRYSNR